MPTVVVNTKYEKCDIDITRYLGQVTAPPNKGCYGNPYPVEVFGDQAVPLFEAYFLKRIEEDPEYRKAVLLLKGKKLGCRCVSKTDPSKPCHGHVYAKWLNATTSI